jgi:hypothetical protein
MVDKKLIKKVFEAQRILNRHCSISGYSPSDFTSKEYNQEIFEILNDKNYRRRMLADIRE